MMWETREFFHGGYADEEESIGQQLASFLNRENIEIFHIVQIESSHAEIIYKAPNDK